MASVSVVQQLPIGSDNVCMVCKVKVVTEEQLFCKTCGTPWHVFCLRSRPDSMSSVADFECPDCTEIATVDVPPMSSGAGGDLVAAIRAIQEDTTLTEKEKAKRRQMLMSGKAKVEDDNEEEEEKETKKRKKENDLLRFLDSSLTCCFCMQLPQLPVSTPCGHNFCLKCFQKWVGQGKRTCAKCRQDIPRHMASQPRINDQLVRAIRRAKITASESSGGAARVYHYVHNQDRPDAAYTTERAKKTGKANAASGKIFVTIPTDFFGPITAEYDPTRNLGVQVGETWADRLECRQWGAHFPHVAGIAGQSSYGAQSVALSGGYVDDEDHGEWFLYTGSGGRDLSGNKRTNKNQSFDQQFEKFNEALRVSCLKGYPVRVVRSHKEKRSNYAPVQGVRYDGVYRIEKCWRKVGIQGYKVCRYLFVRCDNEPAPWTSEELGDRPRPLPKIPELKNATDITERKKDPAWNFEEKDGLWKWMKPPPRTQKAVPAGESSEIKRTTRTRKEKKLSAREKLLKGFSCLICRDVMTLPVTTPCGHNFCKSCLEGAFTDKSLMTQRSRGGRTLRAKKNVLTCPHCPTDISDFLQDPKVNSDLKDLIESLKKEVDNNDSDDEAKEEEDSPVTDNEDDAPENDEATGTSAEKADDLDGDVDSCKVEAGQGNTEDSQISQEKLSSKTVDGDRKDSVEEASKEDAPKKDNEDDAMDIDGQGTEISAENGNVLNGVTDSCKVEAGQGSNELPEIPKEVDDDKNGSGEEANKKEDAPVKDNENDTLKTDGEATEISKEKASDLDGDIDSCKLEAGKGDCEDSQAPNKKLSLKRRKPDADGKLDEDKTRKIRKVQEGADAGNESPLSPLNVDSVNA